MKRILIVDDEAEFRDELSEILTREGYETIGVTSAKEAYGQLRSAAFEVVLLDYMMPQIDGIDALTEIKRLRQGKSDYDHRFCLD